MFGLSLTLFGICHAAVHVILSGPLSRWLGDRGALPVSMAADATAHVLIGLVGDWWMPFALFALGGVGGPVLQSLLSSGVDADNQGTLARMVTSLTSFVSIFAPLMISMSCFATRGSVPRADWLGRQAPI